MNGVPLALAVSAGLVATSLMSRRGSRGHRLGPWVYHGTTARHVPRIRREGLLPFKPRLGRGQPVSVYFAPTEYHAEVWGDVILRFPWPASWEDDDYGDATLIQNQVIHTSMRTLELIPPEVIEIRTPKGWTPLLARKGSRGFEWDGSFRVKSPEAGLKRDEVMVLYDWDGHETARWRGEDLPDDVRVETDKLLRLPLDAGAQRGNFLQIGKVVYRFTGLDEAFTDEFLLDLSDEGLRIEPILTGNRLRMTWQPWQSTGRHSRKLITRDRWVNRHGKQPRPW